MRRFTSNSPICDTINIHRGAMKENVRNGGVWSGRSASQTPVRATAGNRLTKTRPSHDDLYNGARYNKYAPSQQ